MSDPIWKPNTTVAVLVEQAGRYLLVEELTEHGRRYNQPAGHLDDDESLLAAAIREAREETAYQVCPTALVGIYQWSPPGKPGLTYLRFAYAADLAPGQVAGVAVCSHRFAAEARPGDVVAVLDDGIVRAVWLSYEEVLACQAQHRSPLVLQCIEDYRAGRRYPLDLIRHYDKNAA
ncbi:NUDIX hydrolase [Chitinimonas viridis]|uniref:Phosphatase NudJ n=1 Tax=Chitinimonas viridis TaxID=664880 RepID=A0ABT8B3T4_9NEIS|nr:NUDIX hydrolase [Chitinimonas viridis]MDN3576786.1 NUDIX hydrolase [Chitinimonas viridis]